MSADPGVKPAGPTEPAEISDAERTRRRRSRSIALAVLLAALVILFYVITILKLSGGGEIADL